LLLPGGLRSFSRAVLSTAREKRVLSAASVTRRSILSSPLQISDTGGGETWGFFCCDRPGALEQKRRTHDPPDGRKDLTTLSIA